MKKLYKILLVVATLAALGGCYNGETINKEVQTGILVEKAEGGIGIYDGWTTTRAYFIVVEIDGKQHPLEVSLSAYNWAVVGDIVTVEEITRLNKDGTITTRKRAGTLRHTSKANAN